VQSTLSNAQQGASSLNNIPDNQSSYSSVFFSGSILSLSTLMPSVRIVSWLLPATCAISLLQNIMLRGYLTQPYLLAALAGIGLFMFILNWLLLRQQMVRK
jgi:hypothetical protein